MVVKLCELPRSQSNRQGEMCGYRKVTRWGLSRLCQKLHRHSCKIRGHHFRPSCPVGHSRVGNRVGNREILNSGKAQANES